ncbi:Cox family DNA-binding protein [Citrobacter freundii]|nr:Cox family DNA-binding protein [Citrobacter freundii]MDT7304847.1 Cox family DNA-binding protein [Citrobacter freundii]
MKEPAENVLSSLVTPELFAEYIGKTPAAIRKMAAAGKLPVIRMKDPQNPSKKGGEIYIHRGEWDAYAEHLAKEAPPEWHDWKNRLFTTEKSRTQN